MSIIIGTKLSIPATAKHTYFVSNLGEYFVAANGDYYIL